MGELDEPGMDSVALPTVLHALSDPTRLAVVAQLARSGEVSCGHLEVGVAKSTLSQHLRVLRESGLTHTRPDGNQRWISLRRDDLDQAFPGLLDSVVSAITATYT